MCRDARPRPAQRLVAIHRHGIEQHRNERAHVGVRIRGRNRIGVGIDLVHEVGTLARVQRAHHRQSSQLVAVRPTRCTHRQLPQALRLGTEQVLHEALGRLTVRRIAQHAHRIGIHGALTLRRDELHAVHVLRFTARLGRVGDHLRLVAAVEIDRHRHGRITRGHVDGPARAAWREVARIGRGAAQDGKPGLPAHMLHDAFEGGQHRARLRGIHHAHPPAQSRIGKRHPFLRRGHAKRVDDGLVPHDAEGGQRHAVPVAVGVVQSLARDLHRARLAIGARFGRTVAVAQHLLGQRERFQNAGAARVTSHLHRHRALQRVELVAAAAKHQIGIAANGQALPQARLPRAHQRTTNLDRTTRRAPHHLGRFTELRLVPRRKATRQLVSNLLVRGREHDHLILQRALADQLHRRLGLQHQRRRQQTQKCQRKRRDATHAVTLPATASANWSRNACAASATASRQAPLPVSCA